MAGTSVGMDGVKVQEIAEQDWRARLEGAVAVAEQAASISGPEGAYPDPVARGLWEGRVSEAKRLLDP